MSANVLIRITACRVPSDVRTGCELLLGEQQGFLSGHDLGYRQRVAKRRVLGMCPPYFCAVRGASLHCTFYADSSFALVHLDVGVTITLYVGLLSLHPPGSLYLTSETEEGVIASVVSRANPTRVSWLCGRHAVVILSLNSQSNRTCRLIYF